MQSKSFYLPQLDGIRLLAFLMVFASHAGSLNIGAYPVWSHPLVSFYNDFAFTGWAGVDLFFVLSAYLITTLLLREEQQFGTIDIPKFAVRRILRIWPIYYLAVAVALVFFSPNVSFYWDFVTKNIIWMGLFGSNLAIAWGIVNPPGPAIPLWSVSLEEQFYAFWVLALVLVKPRWGRAAIAIGLIVISIITRTQILAEHEGPIFHTWFYATTARLDPIAVGILIAFVELWFPKLWARVRTWTSFALPLGALAMVICVKQAFIEGPRADSPYVYSMMALAWGLLVIGVIGSKFWGRAFAAGVAPRLGRLTFELYVAHGFILELIDLIWSRWSTERAPTEVRFIVGLSVTFAIAFLLERYFSRNFTKLRHRFARVKSGHAEKDEAGLLPAR